MVSAYLTYLTDNNNVILIHLKVNRFYSLHWPLSFNIIIDGVTAKGTGHRARVDAVIVGVAPPTNGDIGGDVSANN